MSIILKKNYLKQTTLHKDHWYCDQRASDKKIISKILLTSQKGSLDCAAEEKS